MDDFNSDIRNIFKDRFSEMLKKTYIPTNENELTSIGKRRAWENRMLFNEMYPEKVTSEKLLLGRELTKTDYNKLTQDIRKWRNGTSLPKLIDMIRLASILHCDIDYLVGRSDAPNIKEATSSNALSISPETASIIKEYPDKYKPMFEALIRTGTMYDILLIVAQYTSPLRKSVMDYFVEDISTPIKPSDSQKRDMRLFATAGLLSDMLRNVSSMVGKCDSKQYPEPNYEQIANDMIKEYERSKYEYDEDGDPIFD